MHWTGPRWSSTVVHRVLPAIGFTAITPVESAMKCIRNTTRETISHLGPCENALYLSTYSIISANTSVPNYIAEGNPHIHIPSSTVCWQTNSNLRFALKIQSQYSSSFHMCTQPPADLSEETLQSTCSTCWISPIYQHWSMLADYHISKYLTRRLAELDLDCCHPEALHRG